ncbi:MAG TPA: hypothetical protein DEB40_08625 [Elusimicrobia bacterium]|nr:hypothetical protein [Elusimicrobiota bacterium]HBT61792.1 hypothetical protein [Elusimicrobiota bacterium]
MALGRPDRVFTETTAAVSSEVWVYGAERASVGLGFGIGMLGRGSAVGTGLGVDTAGAGEKLRLTFVNGELTSIRRRSP